MSDRLASEVVCTSTKHIISADVDGDVDAFDLEVTVIDDVDDGISIEVEPVPVFLEDWVALANFVLELSKTKEAVDHAEKEKARVEEEKVIIAKHNAANEA